MSLRHIRDSIIRCALIIDKKIEEGSPPPINNRNDAICALLMLGDIVPGWEDTVRDIAKYINTDESCTCDGKKPSGDTRRKVVYNYDERDPDKPAFLVTAKTIREGLKNR